MFEHVNPKNGQAAPLISQEVYDIIMKVGTYVQQGDTSLDTSLLGRRAASSSSKLAVAAAALLTEPWFLPLL